MEIITVDKENISKQHICCAIASNNDVMVHAKKAWMSARFDEGLVFKKLDVRGKCFIEYIPCENAWAPVKADGYMYINCLWVAGQFKGKGYSNLLLNECINDCKKQDKYGIVILTSSKKRGFLADPDYLKYKGFIIADTAGYFSLAYLPLKPAPAPQFATCVKQPAMQGGLTLYYTNQCPYTAKYVPLLVQAAANRGEQLNVIKIESRQQAQAAPCPFTTFALYKDGKLLTHEILNENRLNKILDAEANA